MQDDSFCRQLQNYRENTNFSRWDRIDFCRESPLERSRREILEGLVQSDNYRLSVLKKVNTFAGLSEETLLHSARTMAELFFKENDKIIVQDEIGDSFFILEEGEVVVTRKSNPKDPHEEPKVLTRLSNNAHFGEIALLTAEPRSATITVISETAKCLSLTKQQFDEMMRETNQLQHANYKIIGRNVLEAVPLFQSLSPSNKKKLLDAMTFVTFTPDSYICKQGTKGNTFYIITTGVCKVTINTMGNKETEVASLRTGDFFGEIALIEPSCRRTANVISVDHVHCLALNRANFNSLLKDVRLKLMEHQALRNNPDGAAAETRHATLLAKKRRITVFNTHGQHDDARAQVFFKCFARFASEALWNSMYSHMFRETLLDHQKLVDYGKLVHTIMKSCETRNEAVQQLRNEAIRILEMDPSRRSALDHSFVVGLLSQRNDLRDRICRSWTPQQFAKLCRKVKMIRIKPFQKFVKIDERGNSAMLILRGAVRKFSKLTNSDDKTNVTSTKTFYEEDLVSGELMGEAAFSGQNTRCFSAISLTSCDILLIENHDFVAAQDRDTAHLSSEDRALFLSTTPIFKGFERYKLLRIAHVLVQEEVERGTHLCEAGKASKDVCFIMEGHVDVVDSDRKRNVITTLGPYDFVGETGLLNKFAKSQSTKVVESFPVICSTRCSVLLLQERYFGMVDVEVLNLIRNGFEAKQMWRSNRVLQMKKERACIRKQLYLMHAEGKQITNSQISSATICMESDDNHCSNGSISASSMSCDSSALIPNTARTRNSAISEYFEGEHPPASSSEDDVFVDTARESLLDTAYRSSLVHPLDDRLADDNLWKPNSPCSPNDSSVVLSARDPSSSSTTTAGVISSSEPNHEISSLLAQDYDLLMVSATMRNPRDLARVQNQLMLGKHIGSSHRQRQSQNDSLHLPPMHPRTAERERIESPRSVVNAANIQPLFTRSNSAPNASKVYAEVVIPSVQTSRNAVSIFTGNVSAPQLQRQQSCGSNRLQPHQKPSSATTPHVPKLARGFTTSHAAIQQIFSSIPQRPFSANASIMSHANSARPRSSPGLAQTLRNTTNTYKNQY